MSKLPLYVIVVIFNIPCIVLAYIRKCFLFDIVYITNKLYIHTYITAWSGLLHKQLNPIVVGSRYRVNARHSFNTAGQTVRY